MPFFTISSFAVKLLLEISPFFMVEFVIHFYILYLLVITLITTIM